MFTPSIYTQFPDHYSEQQIQQQSDIFVPDGLQLKSVQGSIYNVDIVDATEDVQMRVIPNGNWMWEEPSTKTVYQVNGSAGSPCEFSLQMISYEYCNKEISPIVASYDGTYGYSITSDEQVIRQPNNIWHFDAFEGQKQTVIPQLNYNPNDYYDDWYEWWSNYWSHGFYYGYSGAYPTSWLIQLTNADFRHYVIDGSYWGYGTTSPIHLFSKRTNLSGLSPVTYYETDYVSYLSPYILMYFPAGTQIDFQSYQFVQQPYNEFRDYLEYTTGFVIAGATFDGYNIILRPYCFSYCSINWYPVYGETGTYYPFGMDYIMTPMDNVCVPYTYSYWPWMNDYGRTDFVVPYWSYYNRITGQIGVSPYFGFYYWWGWYGYYQRLESFPYKKAAFYLTQSRPVVENYPGGYCKYTYKNVIISYGNKYDVIPSDANGKSVGKTLSFHSRGTVVDVEVTFKRKNFPDLSSIPNISDVKRFIAYPQNVRPLEYRELSFKVGYSYPQYNEVFKAYYQFETPIIAHDYVQPYEQYLDPNLDPAPPQWWQYYFLDAIFEYAFTGYYFGNYPTSSLFSIYSPNLDSLYQPSYMAVEGLTPCVASRSVNSSAEKLAYFNYAGFGQPAFQSDYYGTGWTGNSTFEWNDQTSNIIIGLTSDRGSPTILNGKLWSRTNVRYPDMDKPQFTMKIQTNSGSECTFLDAYVAEDKFGERGFGDGWFRIETYKRANSLKIYDPNRNLLAYGQLNVQYSNYPSDTPISDMDISPYYFGNYLLDYMDYYPGQNYKAVDVYWFYSSENSYSAYKNGILPGHKPKNQFKPFGTKYQGYANNSSYCTDGVYIVTDNISGFGRNLNNSFSNNPTSGSGANAEIIIGAFYIDTSNSGFSIYPIPIYYIPNVDLTKPYKGCVNANHSIVVTEDQNSNNYAFRTYYYDNLEGKPEVYVKSTWWDDIIPSVKILGPNDEELELDVDYSVERISTEFMPGNYKIKFLKQLGNLYENEYTDNPAKLSDGDYKFYWPISDKVLFECSSFVDNYASTYRRYYSNTNYYYSQVYTSEFQVINNFYGQFYATGNTYNSYDYYYSGARTMSLSNVISLSPISFYVSDCVFTGTIDDTSYAFKCDVYFLEYLEDGELPVNPSGFNNILSGNQYAEGGYNY